MIFRILALTGTAVNSYNKESNVMCTYHSHKWISSKACFAKNGEFTLLPSSFVNVGFWRHSWICRGQCKDSGKLKVAEDTDYRETTRDSAHTETVLTSRHHLLAK